MDRMIITAAVFHRHAVASPFLNQQRIDIRPGFAVDRPAIKTAMTAGDLLEDKIEAIVGFRAWLGTSKDGVIPATRLRSRPLRLTALSGVFDDDAHAQFAHAVVDRTEDPHSRLFHFDDSIDAFRGGER